MLFLGLDDDVLTVRGKTREGVNRTTKFWSERGLICCEDSLDNSYRTMSVETFLRRVKGMCDMLGRSSPGKDTGSDPHLRDYVQRVVDKAVGVARKAQIQGQPSDPTARSSLRAARPMTLCMGATGNAVL